jgi:hypothetical protein
MHEIGVSKPPRSLQIGVSKPPRSLQIWGKQTSAFFQGLSGNNKFLNNVAFNGRTSCLLPGDVWLAVVPWWPSLLSHLIYAAISLRISHGADFCCSASNGQHKRRQHRPSESVWKCLVQWMPRVSRSRKLQVSASKCMRRQQRRLCSMPYVSCTVRSEPRELLPLPPACLLPCTCQTVPQFVGSCACAAQEQRRERRGRLDTWAVDDLRQFLAELLWRWPRDRPR